MKFQYLGINLTKEVKDLHNESNKALKKIEYTKQKNAAMFVAWNNKPKCP